MNLQLSGKNVLVTGGSKGIGQAIAKQFLQEGANVGIVARGNAALEETKQELEHMQHKLNEEAQALQVGQVGSLHTYQADLTNEDEREQCHQQFMEDHDSLDILINNAGGSHGAKVLETALDTYKEAMELNYYAPVHLSQLAANEMRKNKRGSIVNITSIFGRESGGKVTYNNAKSALISFTKAMADEVIQDGIRVNSVAPGSILHPTGNWQKRLDENPDKIKQFVADEIPAGRFGTVEEVANVVLFLASEKASWVVGSTLNVDGGQSRSNF